MFVTIATRPVWTETSPLQCIPNHTLRITTPLVGNVWSCVEAKPHIKFIFYVPLLPVHLPPCSSSGPHAASQPANHLIAAVSPLCLCRECYVEGLSLLSSKCWLEHWRWLLCSRWCLFPGPFRGNQGRWGEGEGEVRWSEVGKDVLEREEKERTRKVVMNIKLSE